jgi:hypothetical protein
MWELPMLPAQTGQAHFSESPVPTDFFLGLFGIVSIGRFIRLAYFSTKWRTRRGMSSRSSGKFRLLLIDFQADKIFFWVVAAEKRSEWTELRGHKAGR